MSVLDVEVTAENVLELIRRLPPRERLRVIATALPEAERDLPAEPPPRPLRSLLGICADLGTAPSAEEIDEVRREMLANFPRDDI
jgi:hypothetical protein